MLGLYQEGHTVQRLGTPLSLSTTRRQRSGQVSTAKWPFRGHTRPLHYCSLPLLHTSPLILPSSSLQIAMQWLQLFYFVRTINFRILFLCCHKYLLKIVVPNFFGISSWFKLTMDDRKMQPWTGIWWNQSTKLETQARAWWNLSTINRMNWRHALRRKFTGVIVQLRLFFQPLPLQYADN